MKIVGFGACMIDGMGISNEKSFFSLYIDSLKKNKIQVKSEIISLGGFPINRVEKYLHLKVLKTKPDIIIIQFGSTDVAINFHKIVNEKIDHFWNKKNTGVKINWIGNTNGNILKKANIRDQLRWKIKSSICKIFNVKPLTSKKTYYSSMEKIISILNANDVYPVVLSPFISGNDYSNELSRIYAHEVKSLAVNHKFMFIDCICIFDKYSKSKVLFNDGLHLSELGHQVVFNEIRKQIPTVFCK